MKIRRRLEKAALVLALIVLFLFYSTMYDVCWYTHRESNSECIVKTVFVSGSFFLLVFFSIRGLGSIVLLILVKLKNLFQGVLE